MLIPHDSLILAIDGARMSLFRNVGPITAPMLKLVQQRAQKSSHTRLMGDDRPGRMHQSIGQGRAAYEAADLHENSEVEFIEEMMGIFNVYMTRAGQRAIIIAPPDALGYLRDLLDEDTQGRLVGEIAKNYCDKTAPELVELLEGYEG